MSLKVKICGITNFEDAFNCIEAGVDCLGFVFYEDSKRNIDLNNAKKIINKINNLNLNLEKFFLKSNNTILTAGVFVNKDINEINKIINETGIDIIQLSGNETAEYIDKLIKLDNFEHKILKTVHIKDKADIDKISYYEDLGVNILLDTYVKQGVYGGTGTVFNWEILDGVDLSDKIIAGGVSYENIAYIKNILKPYAVDLSSKVEKFPGKKDHDKVKLFFENLKITANTDDN
ncbi:MAG: phosphoribosylanthranilate isomerase [Candidatus Acididesulfobacter diazotrophicus]|uniref:N-(5'-phosphoribosyl)anthranilate isomerase n=1 Tax=Candidatus Acididesulfobacter diazotrophicus TaxID=2597226 RepID=A0A519BQ00_9DELT|nr:MAG: phosphoribosylanthranilate isomerase [Candidatus Acididesulfobacter diazotrophicus]